MTKHRPSATEFALERCRRVLRHPLVKDKSRYAIQSRVARHLNRNGYKPQNGRAYFTCGAVVDEIPELEKLTDLLAP